MPRVPTPIKHHGGKAPLASRLAALLPPHLVYCEPYFGGGSVLLAKSPHDCSEVVNDLDRELANFWRVMQVPELFEKFLRVEQATPFSEAEFVWAKGQPDRIDADPALAAHAFFVRARQSLAGRGESFTPVTTSRLRRGMNEQVSAWLTAVEGLPAVHARMKRVLVFNRPALKVIADCDSPDTAFYLDPPYLHDTRAAAQVYRHEMDEADHLELLRALSNLKGRYLLSGYPSKLYDEFAKSRGWRTLDFQVANHAAGGARKRRMVERVYANHDLAP